MMSTILMISALALGVLIILAVYLFFKVRDIYLRIQVINTFNSLCTIFIAVYCYYMGKPEYIDMAFGYAVLGFIAILGFKKYFDLNENKE